MCGRYTLTQVGPRLVGERFQLGAEPEIEPATLGRFNVCPTEDILVVTHKGPRAVRWGLVPSYSKQIDGPLMINARAESVASKKVFARLLERPERRCLVIADGWYEWLKSEKKGEPRVPFRYTIDGGELFAFAGLCDVAKIDGATLSEHAFVLRWFDEEHGDRLLVVNLDRELPLAPPSEPLLAPPHGTTWQLLWSSEDPAWSRVTVCLAPAVLVGSPAVDRDRSPRARVLPCRAAAT